MLAALAGGRSTIEGYAPGADCRATLACLRALGVDIVERNATGGSMAPLLEIEGRGLRGLAAATQPVDARNSGTTMRLLAGIVAAHPFVTTIAGDESLSRRPMQRVIEPLVRMGARIDSHDGRAPLTIAGGALQPIDFTPRVPSAQVKSAVLLAGLQAPGTTRVNEPAPTRDHTERALSAFGGRAIVDNGSISVTGGQTLHAASLRVPGDPSSAAFWAVAAAGLPGSAIEIRDVGLNPTRIAFVDALRRAGARVEVSPTGQSGGEPVGTIAVRHGELRRLVIAPEEVPGLIDELPALAALATFGGEVVVTGASELRVKESDRISCLASGLRALGGVVEERPDGFRVQGTRRLAGGTADAAGDHRLAMAFAIAALGAERPSVIAGAQSVAVSYPAFFDVLETVIEV